jgi:hypothetical protein
MSHNPAARENGQAASSAQLKFSFAKGGGVPAKPAPKQKNTTTTIFAVHEHSDSEDETRVSRITHLDTETSIKEGGGVKKEEKAPLVIKPPESSKEHWLERRLKLFRPDVMEKQALPEIDLSAIPDRIGDQSVKAGLQLPQKPSSPSPMQNTPEAETPQVTEESMKTDEELSREMLIREALNPNGSVSTAPKLIIPAREPLSETDVYAHDMAHLSDAPTLETYERVPVEAFGMGILLGLGWKEGTDLQGKSLEKVKEPKKRPDFLGIGAKEEEFLRTDAKGNKLSRKDGLGASWNPLKRVHKETGEVLIEDSQSSRQSSVEAKYRKSASTSRHGSRMGTPSGRDHRYREDGRSGDSSTERGRRHDREHDRDRHRNRLEEVKRDGRQGSNTPEQFPRKDQGYDSERSSRDRDYDSDRHRDLDRKRREEKSRRSRGRSRENERDRDYHRSQR